MMEISTYYEGYVLLGSTLPLKEYDEKGLEESGSFGEGSEHGKESEDEPLDQLPKMKSRDFWSEEDACYDGWDLSRAGLKDYTQFLDDPMARPSNCMLKEAPQIRPTYQIVGTCDKRYKDDWQIEDAQFALRSLRGIHPTFQLHDFSSDHSLVDLTTSLDPILVTLPTYTPGHTDWNSFTQSLDSVINLRVPLKTSEDLDEAGV
ncbi:hypothetical protein AAG570_007947 [Ranatra chinensis]|uniref:Uncharacterized protein n=1 Tax=Ranatra chinensis TaxID=642074 RepID=A0ABD0XTA8_9HEMI